MKNTEIEFLDDAPPLLLQEHGHRPERRQVSGRWLASTVLVGLTSTLLMGGALLAALEGREKLTVPAQAYLPFNKGDGVAEALRGDHPVLHARLSQEESKIIMVSKVSKSDGKNIVKVRPFVKVSGQIAAAARTQQEYPSFNALAIFSDSSDEEIIANSSEFMYGANVEGEVTLNEVDFPFHQASTIYEQERSGKEIEKQMHAFADSLEVGAASVSVFALYDTEQFSLRNQYILTSAGVSITSENVSVIPKNSSRNTIQEHYEKRLIKVHADAPIVAVLESENVSTQEAILVSEILESDLSSDELKAGDRLQTWFRHQTDLENYGAKTFAKISLYRGNSHLVSIARDDDDQFVYAIPAEKAEEIFHGSDEVPLPTIGNFPSVYDGIYRTALAEGLPEDLVASLIRIFGFSVDLRSRVTPQDRLEVFVSIEEGEHKPTAESEILYAGLRLGNVTHKYYRFVDASTGHVGYFDEAGKSAKNFLIRNPVPTARFTSGFGMRLHPVYRVRRMHWGVDWAAPRGTPIIAPGNGVVEKTGWAGGYGRRLVIRHLNGYKTTYGHLSSFGKGIKPGARVRQGQVIARVGNTGVSTGPHLHYELRINGKRVDPMRVRLPKGKVLRGEELATFEAERKRIDALLIDDEELELASN